MKKGLTSDNERYANQEPANRPLVMAISVKAQANRRLIFSSLLPIPIASYEWTSASPTNPSGMYVIESSTFTGTWVYTKGTIRGEGRQKVSHVFVSSKLTV